MEDESSSQSTVSLIVAAICTLVYVISVGIDTPLTKAGAVAVVMASLALGALLYQYIMALVGLVVLLIVCLGIFAWVIGGDKEARASHVEPAETATQASPPASAYPVQPTPNESVPLKPAGELEAPLPSQASAVPAPSRQATPFVHSAALFDPRGKVVLQSGPSMLSKNVATLPSGMQVMAEAAQGKWIRIRTSGGLEGYVRLKQLEFSPSAAQSIAADS